MIVGVDVEQGGTCTAVRDEPWTLVTADLRERFHLVIDGELHRLRRRAPRLSDADLRQVEAALWRVVRTLFLDQLPRVEARQLAFVHELLAEPGSDNGT